MKKILPYLKYIVPIACVLSVTIVIFMAMKVDDLKNQKEDRDTEYNTAAEEFFDENEVENNAKENEIEENAVEEEDEEDEEKPLYIVTYDINEIDDENTVDEEEIEPSQTGTTSDKVEEARGMVVNLLGEEDFSITYKELTDDGKYIFEVLDKATNEIILKRVDLEAHTIQTIE